jgi:hypothetical protein
VEEGEEEWKHNVGGSEIVQVTLNTCIELSSNLLLKDRLQEVPKSDKWSRRYLSFPGNLCQHLRDISALRQYSKRL